jgi:hypothetical protein
VVLVAVVVTKQLQLLEEVEHLAKEILVVMVLIVAVAVAVVAEL